MTFKMTTDLIIDTDIGDDIDDTLALALVLSSERLRPRAISTVYAEVHQRARLAAHMLRVWGRGDIPVVPGESLPYVNRPRTGWAAQCEIVDATDVFDNVFDQSVESVFEESACNGLRRLTLLAIGALTNLARAFDRDAKLPGRFDEIVMMGGSSDGERVEWNIGCDPEAAQIVFNVDVPIRIIPIEITERCLMRESFLSRIRSSDTEHHRLISRLIAMWAHRNGTHAPVLHDPLAVGCMLWPELYRFEPVTVDVLVTPEEARGVTIMSTDSTSKTLVCKEVDYEEFLNRCEEVWWKNPPSQNLPASSCSGNPFVAPPDDVKTSGANGRLSSPTCTSFPS
jgi:inosine-uridine nucleoside N-ribohydrolase